MVSKILMNTFFILGGISFGFLSLGLIVPDVVLWGVKEKNRKQVIKYYGTSAALFSSLALLPQAIINFSHTEGILTTLYVVLALFFMGAIAIGMFKPSLVLRWGAGKKTRHKVLKYYGFGFLVTASLYSVVTIVSTDGVYMGMRVILSLLILFSFVGLIVGLFKPDLVIFWQEEQTREQVAKYYGGVFVVSFIVSYILFLLFSVN